MSRTLVLGGARSGKSRCALEVGESLSDDRVFVATGVGFDVEIRGRIARHRADRDSSWRTVEEAVEVWDVIARECRKGRVVVLDCLTLWLNNVMLEGRDVESDLTRLVESLEGVTGELILVSNEVGMGLVPDTELGREFRDLHGRMNQAVASVCDRVLFMVAGLPVVVKGEGAEVRFPLTLALSHVGERGEGRLGRVGLLRGVMRKGGFQTRPYLKGGVV